MHHFFLGIRMQHIFICTRCRLTTCISTFLFLYTSVLVIQMFVYTSWILNMWNDMKYFFFFCILFITRRRYLFIYLNTILSHCIPEFFFFTFKHSLLCDSSSASRYFVGCSLILMWKMISFFFVILWSEFWFSQDVCLWVCVRFVYFRLYWIR